MNGELSTSICMKMNVSRSIYGMCEIIGVEQTQNLFYTHMHVQSKTPLTTYSQVQSLCALFYRWRQAHKLSKLNWIPFILMLHYQTISIWNDGMNETHQYQGGKNQNRFYPAQRSLHVLRQINKYYTVRCFNVPFLRFKINEHVH